MTLTMNEAVAREVIRSRVARRRFGDRPRHVRTTRSLRAMADRLDGG